MKPTFSRRIASEFVGTAFLLATIIGSGIMAEELSGGNVALAILVVVIATGAVLVALIFTFGPISGAHLNPVVTTMDALERGIPWRETPGYIAAQVTGGIFGAMVAHWMFGLPALSLSVHARSGPAQLLSEFVATFGLMCVIWGTSRIRPDAVPLVVGAYITAACWFTASTCFANPAVTIARSLSNTFTGIRPLDVPGFVIAQFLGGLAATLLFRWLVPSLPERAKEILLPEQTEADD
jgi:glycerol uptake facilitator-like aquaporin